MGGAGGLGCAEEGIGVPAAVVVVEPDGRGPGADQLGTARPRDGDDDGTAACDLGASEYACGLLGIEPLLVLPFARRLARARRRRPSRG